MVLPAPLIIFFISVFLASSVYGVFTREDYKHTYYERAAYPEHQVSYRGITNVRLRFNICTISRPDVE